MSLSLVTGPALEPLTVAEAKLHARIDVSEDDALVQHYIIAARQKVDGPKSWCGRALITQTWDLFLPGFPACIDVPLPPLQSVTTVKYLDANGTQQTLAATEYVVDTKSEPGRIVPAAGKSWPSTGPMPNALEVRFVAGYGAAPAQVPEVIKQWLRQAVAFLYDGRGAVELPNSFYWALANYRMTWGGGS